MTGGANVAWGNATSSDAAFGGVGGTVTVGTVTANDLTFNSEGYLLTGGTITLNRPGASDNPNITVADGVTASIASTLAGTRTITKDGAGKLVLSGANTFSGALSVSAGVLNIRSATALGTTGGATTVSAGAALEIDGGIAIGTEALTLNGAGVAGTGALRNISGSNSLAGAITLGSATVFASDSGLLTLSGNIGGAGQNISVSGAGDITLSGAIGTGAGTLTKSGAGTLTLSGGSANTFTGLTTLTEGTLVLNKTAGVNALAGPVTVSGGTLALGASNQIAATAVTVASGTFDIGAFSDAVGAVTLTSGQITGTTGVLSGTSYALQSGTVSAILGGTGTLTKSTAGTVTLTRANTYTGATTVSAGVLNIRNATALGTTAGATTVSAGAMLEIEGGITVAEALTLNGTGVSTAGALRQISGANTMSGDITLGSATLIRSESGLLTLTGNITGTNTNLTFDGSGDVLLKTGTVTPGTSTILKTGTGTLTLQGSTGSTGTAFEAREGVTIFDYSISNTTRVGNTATLTFSGGTIGVTGGSDPETLLATSFTRGASKLIRLPGDTGTSSIRLNALSRTVGATFDMNGTALADTDTVNTNGIIGGWFTLAGTDFASNSVSTDGPVLAATYVNDTWGGANNTTVTTSGALSGATTNSLRFNATGAATLTLSGTNTLTSGGLLVSGNVGANDTTISGGILRGGASGDLIVHQYNTGGALLLASTIVDNGGATALTKAGAGKLILTGDNTFTGAVYLNEGDLTVTSLANGGSPSGLGASSKAASNLVLQNGAKLSYAGAANASTDRAFTAAGSSVGLESNGVGTLSFTDSTAAVAYDTPNVKRTLILSGTNAGDNTFTLTLGDNGTAKTSLIKNGIGKWVLTGLNGYTGSTQVNEGTLVQNGSATGSAHTVNATATLGGSGSVGALTLNGGGTLSPGATGGAIGTLTVAGDLTWNGGGVMRLDLGAGGASDRINLSGALLKGTAGTYAMDFGGTGEAGVYTLISGAAASNFTADQFTYANLRTGMSGLFSFAGSNLIFTVAPLAVIPEPQEYALGAGALAAVAAGVRRARRKRKTA